MSVQALGHYTLRCTKQDLPHVHRFYTEVIGLRVGARPEMSFDGYWLYADRQPVVHLMAVPESPVTGTGSLDHVAFQASGLQRTRTLLAALRIPFKEAPVPGWSLHQLFVSDPLGVKVELTFDMSTEAT